MPPIIEKQKILEANERSVYQLLERMEKNVGWHAKNVLMH